MESADTYKRIIAQHIKPEVIEALDALFPERTPELKDSMDAIRFASGQRSVVRFLKTLAQGPEQFDN